MKSTISRPLTCRKSKIRIVMDNDEFYLWESIKYKPPLRQGYQVFRIRVYCGLPTNPQGTAFKLAWTNLEGHLKSYVFPNVLGEPEFKNVENLKNDCWKISDLVDWLLGGDIHFILGHVHQGFGHLSYNINIPEVLYQLKRLYYHVGFPCGEQLKCPVFTQNKIEYLKHLGYDDMANPTLVVDIPHNCTFSSNVLRNLKK